MKAEELCGRVIFTGKHTYWDAFLLVEGGFGVTGQDGTYLAKFL